jgi:hypothetical protein
LTGSGKTTNNKTLYAVKINDVISYGADLDELIEFAKEKYLK